ncbi:MAG TPA: LON peptidase substrate-binding domain-containing protein [Acidimicrobiales bacterium]|nr:LON peptidase substrate-binding domain-containing protein [Acidimicrobiales bacterium]
MTAPTREPPAARHLAMFPLGTVLFPHARIPLHVFEPRFRALTKDCLAGDSRFGVVLIERGSEVGGGDQRMAVGTRAVITRAAALADGRWLLLVQGESRVRIGQWLADDPYPLAVVEEWPDPAPSVEPALLRRAVQSVRRTRGLLTESGSASALSAEVTFDQDPEVASWQICAEAPLSAFDGQRLLSVEGTGERLELLIELTEAVEQDLRRMLSSG